MCHVRAECFVFCRNVCVCYSFITSDVGSVRKKKTEMLKCKTIQMWRKNSITTFVGCEIILILSPHSSILKKNNIIVIRPIDITIENNQKNGIVKNVVRYEANKYKRKRSTTTTVKLTKNKIAFTHWNKDWKNVQWKKKSYRTHLLCHFYDWSHTVWVFI